MSVIPWEERAACVGIPEFVFFPSTGESGHTARKICAACPVASACLTFALEFEHGLSRQMRSGVYGGLSPYQRAQLTRKVT